MLEAYLFIDPLCKKCIQSEKMICKLANHLKENLSYHFIPMLNIQILNKNSFQSFPYKLYYKIVLDYKAALFQGRKRGQKFFMMLQNELIYNHRSYNNKLVMALAENTKLDLDMFRNDRRSKLAQESFKSDQQLVYEMNIHTPSSAVIFNCNEYKYGILIKRINYYKLVNICCPHHNANKLYDNNGIPIPNLHIKSN